MSEPVTFMDGFKPDPGMIGRVPDLPDSVYRADPGISNSNLKEIVQSVARWKYIKTPDTVALALGRAIHLAVFQPDHDLSGGFVCAPNKRGYKTMGSKDKPNLTWGRLAEGGPNEKDLKANPEVEAIADKIKGGAALVLHDALDSVRIIADAVRSHPYIRELIKKGHSEVSYFAETPDGIRIKCRIDWETRPKRPVVLDMKTAINAALRGEQNWWSAVRKYGYDQQRVFYSLVMREAGNTPMDFEFIVPDKTLILAMHAAGCKDLSQGVARYKMGKEMISSGADKISEAMEKLRESRRSGIEGYSRDAVTLGTDILEDF